MNVTKPWKLTSSLIPALHRHPAEAGCIGRILASYGELELSLCFAVSNVIEDFDLALKVVFGGRGELRRIQLANALGRRHYEGLGLSSIYNDCMIGLERCRLIRNQYAHCQWSEPEPEKLCFVSLEHLARSESLIEDLSAANQFEIDLKLLREQEAFFDRIGKMVTYLNFEGRLRSKKINANPFPYEELGKLPEKYVGIWTRDGRAG